MPIDPMDGTLQHAAAGIFDAFPSDPFGDESAEVPTGTEESEDTPPAGDESSDDDFDAEGADALEGEEAEGEDEEGEEYDADESEDDDEGEGDEELVEDLLFTVRVDGKDDEVTEAELLAGYSRTESWTRKSQALADERRAFEEQQRAVEQERAHYGQALQTLEQRLQADMPQRPAGNDPEAWIEYSRKREELAEVEAQQSAVQARQRSDFETARQRAIADENAKLVEIIPEWADTEVAMAEKNGLSSYAMGLGYSVDEIEGIVDHRAILLLRAAKAYDDLGDAKKAVKVKAKKARTLKPGQAKQKSPAARSKTKKARSRRENLKRSGHVRDAAAYIHDTLLGDIPDD